LILTTHVFVRSLGKIVRIPVHVKEWMAGVLKTANQMIMLFATKNFASKKKDASASTSKLRQNVLTKKEMNAPNLMGHA